MPHEQKKYDEKQQQQQMVPIGFIRVYLNNTTNSTFCVCNISNGMHRGQGGITGISAHFFFALHQRNLI